MSFLDGEPKYRLLTEAELQEKGVTFDEEWKRETCSPHQKREETWTLNEPLPTANSHLGIPVFEVSLWYPSNFSIPAFWVPPNLSILAFWVPPNFSIFTFWVPLILVSSHFGYPLILVSSHFGYPLILVSPHFGYPLIYACPRFGITPNLLIPTFCIRILVVSLI